MNNKLIKLFIFTVLSVFICTVKGESTGYMGSETPSGFHVKNSDRDALLKQIALKSWFKDGPYDLTGTFEPKMEILSKETLSDHERWHLRYALDPVDYGYAYLLIPLRANSNEPLPLILAPHSTNHAKEGVLHLYTDSPPNSTEAIKRKARKYGLDLVKRGFVVFAPDRAAYGQRRLLSSGDFNAQQSYYLRQLQKRYPNWNLNGKSVYDLKVALDYLEKFDFIDMNSIGIIGYSLGAWDTVMFMAFDDRVKAGVPVSGGMTYYMPELWTDDDALNDALVNVTSWDLGKRANIYYMLTAPRAMLHIYSLDDYYYKGNPQIMEGYRVMKDYYKNRSLDNKGDFSYYLNYDGHAFSPLSQELAYQWLEERLKPQPENLDLYLLIGQSNMAGRGILEKEDTTIHSRVYAFNAHDEFVLAKEPLHYDISSRGTGPGLEFGKKMGEYYPVSNIGLIPAAVGGTKISYWLPGHSRRLYDEAVRKAKVAMQKGKLKGILWQQGESDRNETDAPLYKERLKQLLTSLRKDLGQDVPIVLGELGDFLSPPPVGLNLTLHEVAAEMNNVAVSKASKLGHIGDNLHFNSKAQRENGQNMANAMIQLQCSTP